MSKRTVLFTAMAILLAAATPAYASTDTQAQAGAEKDQAAGKHNFDQWQTIKRLQVTR